MFIEYIGYVPEIMDVLFLFLVRYNEGLLYLSERLLINYTYF
jgi:hypothetical protein